MTLLSAMCGSATRRRVATRVASFVTIVTLACWASVTTNWAVCLWPRTATMVTTAQSIHATVVLATTNVIQTAAIIMPTAVTMISALSIRASTTVATMHRLGIAIRLRRNRLRHGRRRPLPRARTRIQIRSRGQLRLETAMKILGRVVIGITKRSERFWKTKRTLGSVVTEL